MMMNNRKKLFPLNSNKNLSNKSMTKPLRKLLRLSHNSRTTPKWFNKLRSRRNKLCLPPKMKMMKRLMIQNKLSV